MLLECFRNDLALFKSKFALKSFSTSLPGGDQVDGLPPAASTDPPAASWPSGPLQTYSRISGSFFKNFNFSDIKLIF